MKLATDSVFADYVSVVLLAMGFITKSVMTVEISLNGWCPLLCSFAILNMVLDAAQANSHPFSELKAVKASNREKYRILLMLKCQFTFKVSYGHIILAHGASIIV